MANVSRLVPHASIILPRTKLCFCFTEGDPHSYADRVRLFAFERQYVC